MKKVLLPALVLSAIAALLALTIFLLKSGKKSDSYVNHDVIVQQIEELGNLEVVKYNIQDMMEFRKIRRWLPNPKASLKVSGEVVACIDLTKINKEDIYTQKDSVSIILPMPEICHYQVDHSRSQVYDVEFGLWQTAELVDEAYKAAEDHIRQQAINMGIAQESRVSAIKVLTPILRGLGFKRIYIGFKTAEETLNSERQKPKLVPPKR